MYMLKTSAEFDSAHFLSGYDGKCANIHGHRWTLEVTAAGEALLPEGPRAGMLMDFGELKAIVRELAEQFDHTLIYEEGTLRSRTVEALQEEGFSLTPVPFRPTAENLARYFFGALRESCPFLKCVTVWETPENAAVYEEE